VAKLAAVMAGAGRRVIIVDADLRRPSQHRFHDLRNEVGLSSLLVGEVSDPKEVLRRTALDWLQILTAGPIPPNPAALFGSDRTKNLIEELAQHCDVVMIDCPPVFAAADASILAGIATRTLLVAESGKTKSAVLLQAAEDLQRVGKHFMGVIVNLVGDPRKGAYGGHYGYQYYPRYAYGAEEKKRRLFGRTT
jgi:capsular exopolysaccharide synthesis family protein